MLEPKGTRLGAFNFKTRPLEEDERKFYGIFISHKSDDNEAYLFPMQKAMLERGLYPLCDRDILRGGDDYQNKIESALNCYAAVIIVTKASLKSDWVNYEIGFLSGLNIPIYLFDPELVLTPKVEEGNIRVNPFARAHLNQYLPAYNTMDSLLQALSALSPYSDMFCEENSFLDRDEFTKRVKEHVETIIAVLESDLIDEYYDNFADCKIGTLIPNFGMFYPDHGDGEHCYAKPVQSPLANGLCAQNGLPCALSLPRTLGEDNKECVLLNHVLYNAIIYQKGQLDRRGQRIERGCIVFNIPIHRLYGTEFKVIVDVPENSRYDTIIGLFDKMGLCPSSSSSGSGERIYLSLPERRTQGLFKLNHQFSNNFLCPHAARAQTKAGF